MGNCLITVTTTKVNGEVYHITEKFEGTLEEAQKRMVDLFENYFGFRGDYTINEKRTIAFDIYDNVIWMKGDNFIGKEDSERGVFIHDENYAKNQIKD